MRTDRVLTSRVRNTVQTLVLLGGMGGLSMALGGLVWGGPGVILAVFLTAGFLAFSSPLSTRWTLRQYRARPLSPTQAPDLFALARELARRAELPRVPELYYIPSRVINAFAVGSARHSAIGLTDGLLRRLNLRELAGVLAHELGHIRNGDLTVMALADFVSRLTRSFSLVGAFLLFLNLPFWVLGGDSLPLIPILLLLFAPNLSTLLQLALSRTREFDADLEGARLTGDPRGLALALAKMEYYQTSWLQWLLLPGRNNPAPSYLRTHPKVEERIARLQSLEEPVPLRPLALGGDAVTFLQNQPRIVRVPRWRVSGLWY